MKKLFYVFIATIGITQAALDHGGHTHYSLRQYDTGMGRENSLWHTHTTTDIGNKHGVSLQATPFVSFATDTHAIARHFAHNSTRAITIASDRFVQSNETTLPFHAIKHNTASSPTEESATVTLDPSLTIVGTTLSFFCDGSPAQPGLSGSLSIPVFYIDATMKSSGGSTTIDDYFAGAYLQTAPIQASLNTVRLGGANAIKLGPITGQVNYNIIESERSFAGGNVGISLAMREQSTQKYLLSNNTSTAGAHKLFCGFDAGTTMYDNGSFKAEVMINARYSFLLSSRHNRVLGVLEDDGSIPAHSPYLLGAQKGERGTFPLANILHREITRGSNHQLETNMMGAFTWQAWTSNIGYGLFARRAETISVTEWPEDTYAITYPTYDTDTAFANSTTTGSLGDKTVLTNHRFISQDMLNLDSPASPAQVSVTVFASVGCNTKFKTMPLLLGIGGSYEHSFVDASPSMATIWAKVALSF